VPEYAEVRFNPSGTALLLLGTKTHGQGHDTAFKQILHEKLGIDPADVQYIDGDTDAVAFGMGSNGSRSMVVGGSAVVRASEKIIEKGRKIAAHLMEAAEVDIAFADNKFAVVGTDRSIALKDVAKAAFQPARLPKGMEPGLYENATYQPTHDTFPNSCHVAEVEIDPDTGAVALVSYLVVDDVGTVINPLTLKGQIHGGVAQGVGQILTEQVVYEPESGQLLSASFMDYAMPRADMLPSFATELSEVPAPSNRLGVRSGGEGGTTPALAVVINAIADALAEDGVRHVEMPATSERVWRAIQDGRKQAAE
jgi:carbon-monoxide dehydrogenase large subunit